MPLPWLHSHRERHPSPQFIKNMEHLKIENASPDLSFPWRLYLMLRDAESDFPNVVGWIRHGKAFQVYDIEQLEHSILPKYFITAKYASFRRQLLAYGFQHLGTRGQCKCGVSVSASGVMVSLECGCCAMKEIQFSPTVEDQHSLIFYSPVGPFALSLFFCPCRRAPGFL